MSRRYIGSIERSRMRSRWTDQLRNAAEVFVVARDGAITTMTPEQYQALSGAAIWGTSVYFTRAEAEACAVQRRGARA